MRVRIQLGNLPPGSRLVETQRKAAQFTAVLLLPAALAAYSVGAWRLATDLNWAMNFPISRGIFSHWQVWLLLGGLIHITSFSLDRYSREAELEHDDAGL